MNPRFLNDKYLMKFVKDRSRKIMNAIQMCQYYANNNPEINLNSLDLDSILRIRSPLPSLVFPEAIINAVIKNPKGYYQDLVIDVIDYLLEYRSHMAGVCHDCWINIYDIGEYSFILKKGVWRKASKKQHGQFICIGCLEDRLKRQLVPADFNWDVPLNSWDEFRSERLMQRMGML